MAKDKYFNKKISLNLSGNLKYFDFPLIMGIMNINKDSFFSKSQYYDNHSIIETSNLMVKSGVDIIDIGAQSTRPGAKLISEKKELESLIPALETIRENNPDVIISLDTQRAEIANKCIDKYNVNIINDVSAGALNNNEMYSVVKKHNCPYIIMHMKGIPENMQNNPTYNDVTKEILLFFSEKISLLNSIGINDIIIDPGIGFGKSVEDNYKILKDLNKYKIFELPILIGISRKSLISKVLNINTEESLNGTTILNTISLLNGADLIRVHDVKEAVECKNLINFYTQI